MVPWPYKVCVSVYICVSGVGVCLVIQSHSLDCNRDTMCTINVYVTAAYKIGRIISGNMGS